MCRILWSLFAQAILHLRRAAACRKWHFLKGIFVDLTPDHALRRLVDEDFAQRRFKRTTAFKVSDIQPAMQFVASGFGVAIVPFALARPFKKTGEGVMLRLSTRDGLLPPWRISIFRRMKQKRLIGMGTADLFLAMLPDHLPQ